MSQQRIDFGIPSTEAAEGFHRGARAALFEYAVQKSSTGFRIKYSFFFKRRKYIGGQNLGPLVAIITRGITPCKNM